MIINSSKTSHKMLNEPNNKHLQKMIRIGMPLIIGIRLAKYIDWERGDISNFFSQ